MTQVLAERQGPDLLPTSGRVERADLETRGQLFRHARRVAWDLAAITERMQHYYDYADRRK